MDDLSNYLVLLQQGAQASIGCVVLTALNSAMLVLLIVLRIADRSSHDDR